MTTPTIFYDWSVILLLNHNRNCSNFIPASIIWGGGGGGGGVFFLLSLLSLHSAIYYTVLLCSLQAASQVGALDVGYKPGVTKDELKGVKFLYLLGEVSRPLSICLIIMLLV